MMFAEVINELKPAIYDWAQKLISLDDELISTRRNSQNRSIRQIVGHMVDSASNNTHRAVHLQYRKSPLEFPNYATYGNNDRWIAIQNYQDEDWQELVQLWKFTHLHFLHVISVIDPQKLKKQWIADKNVSVTLEEMVLDFPRHFQLHLSEINQLINITL
ncbi:DinB family protein [Maribellus mangrovi]|uniref:DinB family protein n=1 Tax=Maribellus mangrovi TaxID=3133146 RepID=UPI0030EEA94F